MQISDFIASLESRVVDIFRTGDTLKIDSRHFFSSERLFMSQQQLCILIISLESHKKETFLTFDLNVFHHQNIVQQLKLAIKSTLNARLF